MKGLVFSLLLFSLSLVSASTNDFNCVTNQTVVYVQDIPIVVNSTSSCLNATSSTLNMSVNQSVQSLDSIFSSVLFSIENTTIVILQKIETVSMNNWLLIAVCIAALIFLFLVLDFFSSKKK